MRGRVAAVLVSFFSVAAPLLAQCNIAPVASAQFRSTIFDLSVDGNRLWAATGYGLTLYDLAIDPPPILDTIALPGLTRAVRASNGVAYAASGSVIQVVRWNGRALQLAGSFDIGATINDLLLTPRVLYVATTNGIIEYDLIDPAAPVKTTATFATSGANIGGLALAGDTLYAVDGDASVEVFNVAVPAVPQRLGAFNSLPRPVSIAAADSRVYVSDGQQTDIFVGTGANLTRAGSGAFPFGSSSFAALSSTAVFTAGSDRRLHAFDVSSAGAPVEIFRQDLAPTSGTVNRVNAVAVAGGRLYAGAGDIGLLTYDVRNFTPPFNLRAYSTVPTNSVVMTNGRAYFGRDAGIVEYLQSVTGAMTEARSWDKSRPDVVQDVDTNGGLLLTSSGAELTLWALTPTTPVVAGTATFRKPVRQAVLIDLTAYAVLDDRTVWAAELSVPNATPRQIPIDLAPLFIRRSGAHMAVADLRDNGTTTIARLDRDGAVTTRADVAGSATAGIALSDETLAVWTFRGITVIDFTSGQTTLLPQSNTVAAKGLAMAGFFLVEMTDSGAIVWNTQTQRVLDQYTLPAAPAAVAIGDFATVADLATFDGVTAVRVLPSSVMPSLFPAPNANFYAKKLVATANRVVLFDGRNADIFSTSLAYRGGIHGAGAVDVAANDDAIFTLTNTLGVGMYTRDGEPLRSTVISEAAGAQPLSLAAVPGAVWASIVRGCPLDCEKKTIVLDARNGLTQTTTMTGAVRDVAVSGTRAYVLTELPDEIRLLDISDPAHPRELAKRAAEGTRLPTSIAFANGTVYVLGEKLYTYNGETLAKVAELLGAYVDDPASGVTYADQRVRADGGCVAISGRQFSPQLFTATLDVQPSFATPSPARAITAQGGRLFVLTDHSVEVWGAVPLAAPARRRPAQ